MFFKKKRAKKAEASNSTTPYFECKTPRYETRVHIRDKRGIHDSRRALCGAESLGGDLSPVTIEDYRERSKDQDRDWEYCRVCSLIFIVLHDDQQAKIVIKGAYDPSPGRWCDKCKVNGSHHTDRHDAYVIGAFKKDLNLSLRVDFW